MQFSQENKGVFLMNVENNLIDIYMSYLLCSL